jgi:ribonucleotide reductase alpha subunit
MISYVTKRDGSIVEFDAEKLNQWSIWASQNCNIRWSDVVFGAIRKVYDKVSTVDIQKALVETCLEKRTEGHTKMAANLLIGIIYKEAFGDFSIPHLKDYYHEMVDDGWWIDMGYTDEELEHLDTVIDHTRDFTYSYASLKQYADKYGIKSFDRLLESPQMTFMGIAMANMVDSEDRLVDVSIAYDKISKHKINLPTPTVALERTPSLPAPSCCVISGDDTVDSIGAASHISYTMTAKSSGIGVELKTRAPKDPVKNGKIAHGGKYSYYSYLDRSVKANRQEVRGGSATVTFNALDPEVLDLLTLKQQRTDPSYRLDHMDYSMAVNHLLLKKAAKNEQWMTVSPYVAKDLWDLSYSGNQEAFEEEYERVLKSQVKKQMVNARDIISSWVTARGDSGRVYITFLDNVNSHTPFKAPIRLANLCVKWDTMILTKEYGNTEIGQLHGEHVTIWNGEEWSNVEVVLTGINKDLLRITVKDSTNGETSYLECTPYHKWYLSDGDEVRAADLVVGSSLLEWVDPNGKQHSHIVTGIEEAPSADTFCFTEEKRGMGVFNGILTGQCQEVMLPTKPYDDVSGLYDQHGHGEVALCNLGSIVVSNIEDDKDYEETAYILAKITDNTIEKGIYPFPQVEYTAKRRRSIGIGMTDLAHLMAKNDLQYDTEEGRNFIHALSEKHSYFLHKASVRLARERGKCEWWDKTKYAEGWLPIDTYAKSVDECHSEPLHMDWVSLRNDIKTNGVRFSVLEAFMPTESSSLLTNSCNGVYPVRKTEIFKSSKKGSVYFRAPDFEIFDYQNAYEIHDLDMVKVYSIIQKFTGQGISADFYSVVDGTTTKLSLKSMLQRVLYAAKMGMKTMYYENFKTDSGEVELTDSSCESCKL